MTFHIPKDIFAGFLWHQIIDWAENLCFWSKMGVKMQIFSIEVSKLLCRRKNMHMNILYTTSHTLQIFHIRSSKLLGWNPHIGNKMGDIRHIFDPHFGPSRAVSAQTIPRSHEKCVKYDVLYIKCSFEYFFFCIYQFL